MEAVQFSYNISRKNKTKDKDNMFERYVNFLKT